MPCTFFLFEPQLKTTMCWTNTYRVVVRFSNLMGLLKYGFCNKSFRKDEPLTSIRIAYESSIFGQL